MLSIQFILFNCDIQCKISYEKQLNFHFIGFISNWNTLTLCDRENLSKVLHNEVFYRANYILLKKSLESLTI